MMNDEMIKNPSNLNVLKSIQRQRKKLQKLSNLFSIHEIEEM